MSWVWYGHQHLLYIVFIEEWRNDSDALHLSSYMCILKISGPTSQLFGCEVTQISAWGSHFFRFTYSWEELSFLQKFNVLLRMFTNSWCLMFSGALLVLICCSCKFSASFTTLLIKLFLDFCSNMPQMRNGFLFLTGLKHHLTRVWG